MTGVDVLAFGVHPDDLEIGIFGTLAKSINEGRKVLLVDLTQGEMGSNGTVEERKIEAQNAADIIGAERICLQLPDRGILVNELQIEVIVKCLRTYRPNWVLYPYYKDYHPDHENGSRLIREGIHSSGLHKYITEDLEPFRPTHQAMYYINDVIEPNLYVDISDVIQLKQRALLQHSSQFMKSNISKMTYLNSGFIGQLLSRDAYMGMRCKIDYAEAIQLINPPTVSSLEGSLI